MAYYRTCPYCGSNNDPGEACDCRAETKKESAPAQRERTQANGYPYTVYQPGRAASRTKEVRPRKSIFQDITQVIVIKQTIEHDF